MGVHCPECVLATYRVTVLVQYAVQLSRSNQYYAQTTATIPINCTYHSELAFSKMLNVKSVKRNRLDVEPDLRCFLCTAEHRIEKLVQAMQM